LFVPILLSYITFIILYNLFQIIISNSQCLFFFHLYPPVTRSEGFAIFWADLHSLRNFLTSSQLIFCLF